MDDVYSDSSIYLSQSQNKYILHKSLSSATYIRGSLNPLFPGVTNYDVPMFFNLTTIANTHTFFGYSYNVKFNERIAPFYCYYIFIPTK